MKFNNSIMKSIYDVTLNSKFQSDLINRSSTSQNEKVDFIDNADEVSIEMIMADYFSNHDTTLGMDEISKMELGREYNAAEIYAMFNNTDLNDLYKIIREANYMVMSVVKKVREDDDIVVILTSWVSWDSLYMQKQFTGYDVGCNHYYVINKRGE